ncbi:MAG: hypothetical protein DHS20C19_10780 [Acidimicrobiales bacterium]|nr:MAG: hypothetical protein DHS20C19_10780 [Acidimicrobiales bacterium]
MSRTMQVPIWSERCSGPRVLIEETDFAKQEAVKRILRDRGYEVAACGGPEATDDRCALVAHDQCDAVARADVVVHSMRPQDPRNREVLTNIIESYPDVPVIVEAPRPYVERQPEDFVDCAVIYQPMTARTLIEVVEKVLAESPAPR